MTVGPGASNLRVCMCVPYISDLGCKLVQLRGLLCAALLKGFKL